jgi:hypothetical protein
MKRVLRYYSLLGIFSGFFIFHPLIMILSRFMHAEYTLPGLSSLPYLTNEIHRSFSPAMLPWSTAFALLTGIIGFYYGKNKLAGIEQERLIDELQQALSEVKTLSGLLPMCASCKGIRDDQGYWNQLEEYLEKHSDAQFSHGICPECVKKLYPDIYPRLMERMKEKHLQD